MARHELESHPAGQGCDALLPQALHTFLVDAPVEARYEQGTLTQHQLRMDTQAEPVRQFHVDRLVAQDLRQALVAATAELDDEMLARAFIRQAVIQIEQTVIGAGQQELGPFALHS